jgi:hypothetical protein
MMGTPLSRVRARLSLSWSVFGRPIAATNEMTRVLTHAARTRRSSLLVAADLRHRLRHPAGAAPPAPLKAILEIFPDGDVETATWLVHQRPSGRTIVHEISPRGGLNSVLKIGRVGDLKLEREQRVLGTLTNQTVKVSGAVFPVLLAVATNESILALRTRLNLDGLAAAPYPWSSPILGAMGKAMVQIREETSAANSGFRWHFPPEPSMTDPSGSRKTQLAPSHGDFTAWNLFLLHDGPGWRLGIIDFEEFGLWPAWWDAARLIMTGWEEGRLKTRNLPAVAGKFGLGQNDLLEYSAMRRLAADRGATHEHRTRTPSREARWLKEPWD